MSKEKICTSSYHLFLFTYMKNNKIQVKKEKSKTVK